MCCSVISWLFGQLVRCFAVLTVPFCFNYSILTHFNISLSADTADTAADPTNEEEVEDEHQYLGINRAAVSRSQAHTLPFIQSDYHWRCSLTGAYITFFFVTIFLC